MKKIRPLCRVTGVLGLTACWLAFAGGIQNAAWKGKIVTENGIRVVLNTADPVYEDVSLDFAEDLRIGKEGDAQAQFYRVRDVAADGHGNIYIDDMSNNRIQVFDPKGGYLRTIGRAGQGPGEFEHPTLVRIGGREGRVHVMDRFARINLFDAGGVYLRSIVTEQAFEDYFPDDGDGFVIIAGEESEKDLSVFNVLCRIDAAGKMRAALARYPYTLYMEKTENGGILSSTTGHEMQLYAAPLPGNGIVYGYSKDYELVVLGPDDKKRVVIRKEETRPEFTAAEKAGFRRIPVPKLKPFFYGVLTDPEGRIYVHRNMNVEGKRGFGPIATQNKRCDVFSREGAFLFRTELPPNARAIGGGYVYSYLVDEDAGLEYVQRFRIKNYSALPVDMKR